MRQLRPTGRYVPRQMVMFQAWLELVMHRIDRAQRSPVVSTYGSIIFRRGVLRSSA